MAKKKIVKKTTKKMVRKYRVVKDAQSRDFDYQYEARDHLVDCLQNGAITFCSIKKVDVEEE